MKLILKSNVNKIPKFASPPKPLTLETIAHVKLFLCGSDTTWYVCTYDPKTTRCRGIVTFDGMNWEEGDFSIRELETITCMGVFRVERDTFFSPRRIRDIAELGHLREYAA